MAERNRRVLRSVPSHWFYSKDRNKRREVPTIAKPEYETINRKPKAKTGGPGVMSSLMGKSMTDVDLIWVVPKVKDLEYPPGEPIEPAEVIIPGETSTSPKVGGGKI